MEIWLRRCFTAAGCGCATLRLTCRAGSEALSLSSAGELASMARVALDPGGDGRDASVSGGVSAAAALAAQQPISHVRTLFCRTALHNPGSTSPPSASPQIAQGHT